jgi:hypothetical protein
MVSEQLFTRFYPHFRFADPGLASAAAFYDWVRQYTNAQTIMLNLGAGGPRAA